VPVDSESECSGSCDAVGIDSLPNSNYHGDAEERTEKEAINKRLLELINSDNYYKNEVKLFIDNDFHRSRNYSDPQYSHSELSSCSLSHSRVSSISNSRVSSCSLSTIKPAMENSIDTKFSNSYSQTADSGLGSSLKASPKEKCSRNPALPMKVLPNFESDSYSDDYVMILERSIDKSFPQKRNGKRKYKSLKQDVLKYQPKSMTLPDQGKIQKSTYFPQEKIFNINDVESGPRVKDIQFSSFAQLIQHPDIVRLMK